MDELEIKIVDIAKSPEFIDAVKDLGDANSKTIGFFPRGAFDAQAAKNLIILATSEEKLLGYLMYREVKGNNTISITHLCVDEQYRKYGIAEKLFKSLKNKTSQLNGIYLKCRKDYDLDKFWQKLGFTAQAELSGRSKQGSTLVKWWFNNPDSSIQQSLFRPTSTYKAVLDANVLYDLVSTDVANESNAILVDWLEDIDICVTNEIYNEINRSDDSTKRELSRKEAQYFVQLHFDSKDFASIVSELKNIHSGENVSDVSDRKQLAHSIGCNADYFLTRDKNLLSKSNEIFNRFGLSVIRPSDLIIQFDEIINEVNYKPNKLLNISVEKQKVNTENISILYDNFSVQGSEKKSLFESNIRNMIVDVGNTDTFVIRVNDVLELFVLVSYSNEEQVINYLRVKNNSTSLTILHKIIFDLLKECISREIHLTRIIDQNIDVFLGAYLVLQDFGFQRLENSWVKKHIPGLYQSKADFFIKEPNLKLLDCKQIENKYWPCKILGHNNNFIVSIETHWARELFDEDLAVQDLLGASSTKLIFSNKNVYYRSSSRFGMKAGDRILWYVKASSRHKFAKSIRALSVIESVSIDSAKNLFKKYKNSGIFKWSDIMDLCAGDPDKNIMAIVFKYTEQLENPVSYSKAAKIIKNSDQSFNNFQAPLLVNDKIFTELINQSKKRQ